MPRKARTRRRQGRDVPPFSRLGRFFQVRANRRGVTNVAPAGQKPKTVVGLIKQQDAQATAMTDAPPDTPGPRTQPDDAQQDDFAPRHYPIADQIARQRRTWKHERIGFVVLLAFIALALSGLFASGPLSRHIGSSPQQRLTVEYERFLRNGASSRIVLVARTSPSARATLRIDRAFLRAHVVENLQPQPLSARSHEGGLELAGQADERGEFSLYLTIRPDGIGLVRSTAWFEGDSVVFTQFIYP